MHRCAILLLNEYGGLFPEDPKVLESLPGIGRSTAGAIAAFAYAKKTPILDANVKRVLSRVYGIQGDLQSKKKLDELWDLAKKVLPKNSRSMPIYTQAFMDFGATWCTTRQPVCLVAKKTCPFTSACFAFKNQRVLDLPQKKQKKITPEFYTDMALIFYKHAVLLIKRPPDSIWGGLWCLPESPWLPNQVTAESTADSTTKVNKMKRRVISQMLKNIFSAEELDSLTSAAQEFQMGISLRHIFSHRRLHIQTWRVDLKKLPKLNDQNLIWAPLAQLNSFGLPQPIKLLLSKIST
jgi:A/G-specific adenine glycosylase